MIGTGNLLNRKLTTPPNVFANPEITVPTASKAVAKTPRMALTADWKTAIMEVKTEIMALKMEEKKLVMESSREGILTFC